MGRGAQAEGAHCGTCVGYRLTAALAASRAVASRCTRSADPQVRVTLQSLGPSASSATKAGRRWEYNSPSGRQKDKPSLGLPPPTSTPLCYQRLWLLGASPSPILSYLSFFGRGGTEMYASLRYRRKVRGSERPRPMLQASATVFLKTLGILGVCPKTLVLPHPTHVHSQEGFSDELARTRSLSMAPQHPHDKARSSPPGIQGSNPSAPLGLLFRDSNPATVPPLPLQEPSCCCRQCPSPTLAWQRFS